MFLLTLIDLLPRRIFQLHLTNNTNCFGKKLKLTLYKHAPFRHIFHYITCIICDYVFYLFNVYKSKVIFF